LKFLEEQDKSGLLVRETIYSAIKYINLKLNSESKQQCVYYNIYITYMINTIKSYSLANSRDNM